MEIPSPVLFVNTQLVKVKVEVVELVESVEIPSPVLFMNTQLIKVKEEELVKLVE